LALIHSYFEQVLRGIIGKWTLAEFNAGWRFLKDIVVEATRSDYKYREHELHAEVERWFSGDAEGYFSKLDDFVFISQIENHLKGWLRSRPWFPALFTGEASESVFQTPLGPEEALVRKESEEEAAAIYAPLKPQKGRPPRKSQS